MIARRKACIEKSSQKSHLADVLVGATFQVLGMPEYVPPTAGLETRPRRVSHDALGRGY